MVNMVKTWLLVSKMVLVPLRPGTMKVKRITTPQLMSIITSLKLFGKVLLKLDVPTRIVQVPVGVCTLYVSTILLEILLVGKKRMFYLSKMGERCNSYHTFSILYR